ncbi:MAG TPA: type II secretion system inner membrane protein GspF [Thermodesulfobacteriota bacterium]|nr:type II secretion system inner membrane protein GspF [Thermodesulfobacteriota bacterium]
MPVFEYEALNASGRSIRGIIDAESVRTARVKLRNQGVYPTEIREESVGAAPARLSLSLFRKVKAKDLAQAFRQLATLLEANIPLVAALSAMIDQSGNPVLRKILSQVREKVREGSSLADALALHPEVFPKLFVGMVRAGEVSGTLALTLGRWADFSEHQVALRQRIRAALTYPAFMFVIGFGVLFFLLVFVIPTVTKIFSDLKQALPWPTLILISVSDFMNRFWWALLGAAVLAGLWLRKYLRSDSGSLFWDRLRWKLPLGGPLHRKLALSRWGRTLGTLLSGGLPLLQALEFAEGVAGNRVLTRSLDEARGRVREGEELAHSLKTTGYFPSVILEMVSVGEKSGELGKMLEKVATGLENEAESDLRGLIALLEPLMILIMGVGVGFIALSILLPILEMSQIVR